MALDEYIYGKIANYFKRRKKTALENIGSTVKLADIKPRLSIFARAITGKPIEIFTAEREGGYKNNNFFLPHHFADCNTYEENLSFYLFRILYLSVQKNLDLNWHNTVENSLVESQNEALKSAEKVLKILFEEFPITKKIHANFKTLFKAKATPKKPADYTFLYGKWMRSIPEVNSENKLKNFNDKAKKAIESEIKTILKANPVEEIITLEVDKKQQEDYVMTHNFEKVDTAEEHDGGWRDFDGDDELDKHSKALEELNMKYTVRVDDSVHSVYQADFVENTTVSESASIDTNDFCIPYDEWDYKKRAYKEGFCKVYPKTITETNVAYYKKTLVKNASTLMGLRKMLTNVNNKYKQQRRQSQGDEFDIDALTDLFVDVHSGHTPSENIYLSKRKKEKDISILMLLDISLSSDAYAANNRVIDVEKQVSILFGEILDEFNVDFSIDCFFSKTRNYATYVSIKKFDEEWNKAKYKVGTIEPEGYTRIGAALRHSGALLDKRNTKNKWVILISDGKPNDYDKYEGKYGINDVKQALRELNERNINSYALAIEAQAKYYLPQMFGKSHYQILTTPVELLTSLVNLYDKIKHQG
ncbi:MAG: VWA domain-containing protein [Flavobacteriaceae bacterium]|nr:VWA domain-containing protein [Flavobacteriaceae bacterium]